ncbi:MAG: translation initiation factor IF-2 [Cyanobacteria bacterium P01_D01_bin.123]
MSKHEAKIRIYDLSRQLGLGNDVVLDACVRLGIAFKSHSSTISTEDAERLRTELKKAAIATPSRAQERPPLKKQGSAKAATGPQILDIRPPSEGTAPAPITPPSRIVSPARLEGNGAGRGGASTQESDATESPSGGIKPSSRPQPPRSPSATRPAPTLKSPTSPRLLVEPQQPVSARPAQESRPLEPKPLQSKSVGSEAASPANPPKTPTPARQLAKPVARPIRERPNAVDRSPGEKSSVSGERARPMQKPQQQVVSPPKSQSRPQLVGSPTRPNAGTPPTRATSITRPTRADGNRGTSTPTKPAPPSKPALELVGPPIRAKDVRKATQESKLAESPVKPTLDTEVNLPEGLPAFPVLGDAPKRPTRSAAAPRRKSESAVDDDMAALLRPPSRTQAKKKRRRSGGEEEGDDNLEVVETTLSAAKQAELDALKPLPRPTAKPPSTHTPQQPAARKRPRPQMAGQRSSAPRSTRPVELEPTKPELLELEGNLTVQELADRLHVPGAEIIKILFLKGLMVNLNQTLDIPTIEKVAEELEVAIELKDEEAAAKKTEMLDLGDIEHLTLRPPVVTIMGHVDHGKTTLLDAIRATKVAAGEAGGITQHIGAYHVDLSHEGESKRVVFLDTPGHEAFTAMRARGAKVTDIAILVVAADDGVQPQTMEAISHARAAEVPIVVAVNKIDKETANPDRVKQELAERGLMPEEWGGDTPMVGVSALAKQNLDDLLEMLLLVAEVGELQANPDRPAKGTVIEANLDKARGPVATMLVQNGTLRVGDTVVAGSTLGRVKAMVDDRGQRVTEAGPSSAVEILGMNEVPAAGDEFDAYPDEKEARQVADARANEQRQTRLQQAMASRRVSLGSLSAQAQEGQLKELNIILKADVQGSAEAILSSLNQLPNDEVQIRVLLAAPGEISETDVDLAAASEAIVIGFNTSLAPGAQASADRQGVDVRSYDIIYNLLEDIRGAMEGLLEPEEVEEPLGQVEVRQVIAIGKGAIAGCYVQSGKVVRNAFVRVRRNGEVEHEGRIDSLKRFKEDVREVASGFECGINIDKFHEWEEGDVMEVYQMVSKRRTLAL